MTTKARVSKSVKIAVRLISLGCLLVAISPRAAHAQGYPPDRYPPPGSYPPPPPNYPPPAYPPSGYPGPARCPQYSGYERFEPRFTFSLFTGGRFGGNIDISTPNVDRLAIGNSLNWGFNAGARLAPHF